MASKHITSPQDENAAAVSATSNTSPEGVSTSNPPALKPKTKRHKTLRTALRQLLNRSTTQAIGRFGDPQDPKNRHVVGTSTMEIETGTKPGETPVKKHVHVSVIMSVSDNPACACPCPPVAVVPTNTAEQRLKKWWWVVVPILSLGIWYTPPYQVAVNPVSPTQVATPVTTPSGTGATKQPTVTKTPTPTPVASTPVTTPPGATGGDGGKSGNDGNGTSVGSTPAGGVPVGGNPAIPGVCPNNAGNFSTVPGYASPHSPNWVKGQTVNWNVKRLAQCGVSVQAYDVCGNLLEAQQYGDNAAYLGQTLYFHKGNQLQIDQLDGNDKLANRTTYVNGGTAGQRVTTAYSFDAQLNRLYEARVSGGTDGSITTAVLWAFGTDGQASAPRTYTGNDQIAANVAQHFYHFSYFTSGNW